MFKYRYVVAAKDMDKFFSVFKICRPLKGAYFGLFTVLLGNSEWIKIKNSVTVNRSL
jgi:hypothetical protein